MLQHVFTKRCIDFSALLEKPSLDHMMEVAHDQSCTKEAVLAADPKNYKKYTQGDCCLPYFGMWGEWLAWRWLNRYGSVACDVGDFEMTDSFDSTEEDYGVDGFGHSTTVKKNSQTRTNAVAGSPVYLQVKTISNPTYRFKANDHLHLTNFMTNAQARACKDGKTYQARYLLWTTAKGLHWSLDKMAGSKIEVVNKDIIKKFMDNDWGFLNHLRETVDLPPIHGYENVVDDEAIEFINGDTMADAEYLSWIAK
jgi:hypothetical protein